jgi:hypothetical protein
MTPRPKHEFSRATRNGTSGESRAENLDSRSGTQDSIEVGNAQTLSQFLSHPPTRICPEGARKPPSSRRRPAAGPTRTRTPSSSRLRALGTRLFFLTSQQRTIRPVEAATAAPCTTATPHPVSDNAPQF